LSVIDRYLGFKKQFPSSLMVHFKDLKATPQITLLEILKYCDISITHLNSVGEILKKDSQENTILAQTNLNRQSVKLSRKDLEEIRETLAVYSQFKDHPKLDSPITD
jgi:hypothetical protein